MYFFRVVQAPPPVVIEIRDEQTRE